jgi:2,5-dihydroxypyridine 5,6-dioxygenase
MSAPTSTPVSYFDTPTSAPLAISELMPGAYHLMEYAAVTAGEQVLILTEHGTDPVVVQAISAAAAYRNADVHVLSVPPFSAGGWDRATPSALVPAAHHAADVVISLTWWGEVHTAGLFFDEIARRRARFVSLHQTATAAALATGPRFPLDLYFALEARATALLASASEIRVTTALGTDVTFRDFATAGHHAPLVPGMWRPFPYGGVNFYPDRTDGVVVIEECTVTGVPADRTTVTLADNRVTAIDGSAAAAELRRYAPTGYYLRHALIGLNPKVRSAGGSQFEREKHAGAFYCGLDALTPAGAADRSGPGHAHCDCQFDRPTITVDGTGLVDDGCLLLLDDPDIRALAERFGPADVLLDPNPRLILPSRYTR